MQKLVLSLLWKTRAHLRYHRKNNDHSGEIVYKTLTLTALIPDATYTVKVDKVIDNKHIAVSMDNGSQATLSTSRDTVDFGKIKPGDSVKLSLIKGQVMVYLDLTSH